MNAETMNTTSFHHKDFRTNSLDNYCCDDYIFCSNFDSGNLGRVELVKKCTETEFTENIIHVEFNVWTTPDCYGTTYESPNRTWFFFSIKGGRPYRNVKINVKNLNRQSKLFGQGMQPVLRIGQYGKWERIKNKPTYNIEDENFSMSFIHQPMDKCDIEYFYAFTYPFTYTECQMMLEKFDRNYQKTIDDINFIMNKLLSTEIDEKTSNSTKIITIITSQQIIRKQIADDGSCGSGSKIQQVVESGSNATKDCQMDATENSTTSSLEALKDLTADSESPYEKLTHKQLLNEIYYHREPLINSLEGRRIDLLTITSFHGIQNAREEKLPNLFPDPECLRCHTFKDKKIIFMSSRVHPGETPASFVLNGFLNLILDKKSIIAQTLRQLYVFKIVPILNPDGVYRGFYRTDTLGQNLNRMYVNPKLETHPSIYAVKKLIKYYHSGLDNCDSENFSETSSSSSSRSIDLPMKDASPTLSSDDKELFENKNQSSENNNENLLVDVKFESQSCSFQDTATTTTSSEIEESSSTKSKALNKNNEIIELEMKSKTFIETLIPEIRTHILNETTPIITKQKKSVNNNRGEKAVENSRIKKLTIKNAMSGGSTNTHISNARNSDIKLKDHVTSIQQRSFNKRVIIKKDVKNLSGTKTIGSLSTSNRCASKRNVLSNHNTNNTNLDITMKTLNMEKGLNDENTNMFLYIDFHGHASKKGVFMYGNHFSNSSEAVECMLLPRLMSINCHHFHYDACNFSERNMYRREKRDGLSKEGSGRVAIFKMTGLIKSYTLESNYNTGKYVNSLPARGKDNNSNHSAKSINLTPPKYTPAIYEEVGRALGPSILDITNSNSLSRIHNSEFRTIQGLRITLRNEIERGLSNSHRHAAASSSSTAANTAVVTTSKALTAQQNVKRIKRNARSASSALPQNDTSKENKLIYPIPWEASSISANPSTSMLQLKSQTGTQTKQLQIKMTRNGGGGSNGNNNVKKTTTIKVRPSSAPMYTTKEFKKKPKALIESHNSSTSCVTKKDVSSFYIPPKKVKVSNKNIFKGTTMKQSLPLPPPPPPLPLPTSGLSNVLQNVNNTAIELNCMNCDVNHSNDQCCQIPSNSSCKSSSSSSLCTDSNCKNLKSPIEAQNANDILPSCSSVHHHCKSIFELGMHAVAASSSYSQSHPNLTTSTSAGNSFRLSRKTETSSSSSSILFKIHNNNDNATASMSNISSNEKNLSIKMKSFGGRKKRINRHETIIIKRKKNKLKSTMH